MTEEELEKEIRKYLKKTFHHEYYDDVVMVMGFAKPREKRIAELEEKLANADYQLEGRDNEIRKLEKENKVLAQNLEDTEIINKALEKENAELKGEADSVMDNWCKGNDPCPHLKKRDEQLTKAKKIIKDLCGMVRELNKPNVQLTNVDYSLSEAEQFLNSEVEK